MRTRVLRLGVLVWVFLAGSRLYGQVDTGAVLGTIRDQSGAVIPNAKVTLTNEGTSFTIFTVTGADGTYVFRPLKIGTYSLAAEFQGFRKIEQRHVRVDVQQQVVVDLILLPGQVTQSIEVTAAPPALQTQESSVGQVVGTREINDLPLNGRNFVFLAQLSAGVSFDQEDTRGLGASGSFAANGSRPAQNNYLLDGIDNNADLVDFLNGTHYVVLPAVDAIQEFKIQTNDYSADVGRSAGAVLNAAIKSGTNELHGSIYEFVRNDKLDAANFFENVGNQKKGEFRLNQFGGSLGGPIKKNKTFFFGDYQGTRVRQAIPYVASVPTNLERSSGYTNLADLIIGQPGTKSDNLGRTFPLGTIMDPSTTRAVTTGTPDPVTGLPATANGFVRDPFVATGGPSIVGTKDFTGACLSVTNCFLNQLPAGRLDPNAISLLNLFPPQNQSGLFSNYVDNPVLRDKINQFDVRVDQNFSERDQLFARVSYSDKPDFFPGPFTGIADGGAFAQGVQTAAAVHTALSETHSFAATTINEARLGYSRIGTGRVQPFANDLSNIPAKYGIQGIPQLPLNGGLPTIVIEGLAQLGSNGFLPSPESSGTSQFTDNLTHIHGKHTFKAGFEGQHLRFTILQPAWSRGYWGFDGAYTDVPLTAVGNTGPAQMLLTPIRGTVTGASDYVGGADFISASNYANTDQERHYYAGYAQDDWKVTPKLTVNLGLRWEYFGQILERYGAQSNFLPVSSGARAQFFNTQRRCNVFSPSSPFLTTLPVDNIDYTCSSLPGLGHSQNTNFAPRVGFAYRVTPKLVARAGYGIFYGGFENSVVETYVDFPYQFFLGFSTVVPNQPITVNTAPVSASNIGTLSNGFSAIPLTPNSVSPSGVSFLGEDFHMKTPFTEGYNFTLQYELTPNQTVSLGYVGNSVRHLGSYTNPNTPSELLPPSANFDIRGPQGIPYPDFSTSATFTSMASNSYYHSLQLNYERRLSEGLQVLGNFTWSNCRTDAVDVLNGTALGGYRAILLPNFGEKGDYGLCDFHIPHVVHVSGIYELPVGNGKRFLRSAHGVTNAVLGGWRTNWILTLQDGQPWTVHCVIATAADFGCNALLVPGQNVNAGPHNVNQWINPSAFASPPVVQTPGQTDYAPLGGAPSQFLGPGFHRMDMSFFKEFATSERTHLEFRAELFNLTNHPNFSPPGFNGNGVSAAPGALDYTSPSTFGKITSTRDLQNDQREVQFALKFFF